MNKHMMSCEKCRNQLCAKRVPILSSLDQYELSKVVNLIRRSHYSKGEIIILQGAILNALIIINSGQVKAYKDTQEGKEQILYIFGEGEFFGEKNLIKDGEISYNVEALKSTNVCMINKNDFHQLLKDYPVIAIKIMEELCNRLDRLESQVEAMGTKNVESRVSAVLFEFANKYGKEHPKGILIELPLSREGIANYIGLTRETVSRKMSLLQDEGIIKMVGNKKVIITDLNALEKSI